MTRPDYVPDSAEDITSHGIGSDHNPSDPDLSSAREVLNAIHSAMEAAGPNGSIFVPAGTYYFGSEDVYSLIELGGSQPRGISVYGEGPDTSTLAVTEHMDPAVISNQTAFIYDGDADHGDVEVRGFTLDVNAPNLGNLNQHSGGADGFSLAGDPLSFSLYNVRITDTYTRGIRCRQFLSSARYCTLEQIGIEYHKDSGSNTHPFDSLQTPKGNTTVIENCKIKNCPGSAINIRYNDGTYRIRNVYAAGTGSQFLKLSAGETVELRRINHTAYTSELESLLPDEPNDGFLGRHFIQSLGDRGDANVTLDMEQISTKNHTSYAFQVRDTVGGPSDLTWVGDRIAFAGSNMYTDDEVIRDRQGVAFRNVDVGEMSVHDSDAKVFETEDSDGSIATLSTGNVDDLGNTGGIDIGSHLSGGSPLNVDVPAEDEVGAQGQRSTEEETTQTETEEESQSSLPDWTARWDGDPSEWSVVSGDSNTGNAYVEFSASSADSHALSWDAVSEHTDTEVLGLVRVGSENSGNDGWGRLIGRGGVDTNGNMLGYSAWFVRHDGDIKLRVEKDVGGSQTTLAETAATANPLDEWSYLRLRIEGSSVKAKNWSYGTTEPDSWDIEVTDRDVTDPGWTGIGSWSGDVQLFDFFSVGTNGEPARLDNARPEITWRQPLSEETVDGTVTLKIAATDAEDAAGSLDVEYRVDGNAWSTASYNSNTGHYEDSWDTAALSDGTHTLDARVTDSVGNTDSSSITVTTDNGGAGPAVDSLSVSEVETDTADAGFAIDWGVSDPDGDLSTVDVGLYDETDNEQEDVNSVDISGNSATGTTELTASGDSGSGNEYTIVLTATDTKGNGTSATEEASASGDNSKPQIGRFSVSESQQGDGRADITVVWDVYSNDSDLQSVTIDVADSNATVEGVQWNVSGNTASDIDMFNIDQVSVTNYDIALTVVNSNGESVSATKSVTV
ncbi:hypothetical protein Har1130_15565 [Haloarcula sp. CBA1130]|uniref:Ig-like domain-containing protein n=1 Tax=unclassified Haloarcula TaxID=2624677 RepID=UPI001248B395|nr:MULTISPECIES: Ig-like domain-containing protein [unclassified Haloarcula]KAA9395879.1 hypothetical protein Har1129_18350 [Haloarcula sp. CBA1129]KAA9400191.1 hypothetical protein Har1130_15565 [Haloarcula sp. CBA1130]